MNALMHVAIFGRTISEGRSSYIRQLYSELATQGAVLLIHEPFLKITRHLMPEIEEHRLKSFRNHKELFALADCVMTIGGDGTLLEAITYIRDSNIPVLGINTGRLGFLTGFSKEEISLAVSMVLNRSYSLDRRSLLQVRAEESQFGDTPFALNEITLHKRETSSMITLHVKMNGKHLNTYWADGLILATPTGSTGYSLSCGGPIMMPDSENFVITPIAPHNLNVRPLVIPDSSELEIVTEVRGKQIMVALDSRSESFPAQAHLSIRKAGFSVSLARKPEQEFLQTLRDKLMWGIDKRN